MTLPVIMNHLEKRGVWAKYPRLAAPVQVGLLGVILTFATPLCCAIFEQKASIPVKRCEADIKEKVAALPEHPKYLYYNKGL